MSIFSRQPSLPPERPGAPEPAPGSAGLNPNARPVPAGIATPQLHAQFAVVGVDTQTGQPISTVIEARSENEAQEIAHQQGIIVDEFKPMHPLAGVAAVQMARQDPRDRFNQTPGYADTSHATPYAQRVGPPSLRPPIEGRAADEKPNAPKTQISGLALLVVVGMLGAMLHFAVLKDGNAGELFSLITNGPQPAVASIDISEPVGVDLASIQGFEDWQYVSDLDEPKLQAGDTIRLEAIIPPTTAGRGHRGSAVIGGQIVRPGGEVGGYRLVLVREKHVLLQKGDKLIALRMSQLPEK